MPHPLVRPGRSDSGFTASLLTSIVGVHRIAQARELIWVVNPEGYAQNAQSNAALTTFFRS